MSSKNDILEAQKILEEEKHVDMTELVQALDKALWELQVEANATSGTLHQVSEMLLTATDELTKLKYKNLILVILTFLSTLALVTEGHYLFPLFVLLAASLLAL